MRSGVNLLASFHMDVLLERVEVQEGKHLVACVVGPVGGKHFLLDRAGIPGSRDRV